MRALKILWTDAVASKLIAQGVIDTVKYVVATLFVGGAASTYFLGLWPKIWEFLLSTQDIPNWVLCILSIITLFCILLSIVSMKSRKRSLAIDHAEKDVLQLQAIDHAEKDVLQLQEDINEMVRQFAADSEIEILAPEKGTHQKVPVTIVVSYKNLPKSFELWVFIIDEYTRTNPKYWPITSTSKVEGGSWSLEYSTTQFKLGDQKRFGAFLVGKDGQKLIEHYRMAGLDMSRKGDPLWTPITESQFTSDMVQCGETRIVYLS